MPQLVLATDLIARVRERADMVNSTFVTDTELRHYLQKSYDRLYNYLVGKYEDYFVKITSTLRQYPGGDPGLLAGTADYMFEADYFKLIKIELDDSGWRTLRKASWRQERDINPNDVRGTPSHYILYGRTDYSDASGFNGTGIRLLPTPSKTWTVNVVYIPTPPQLSDSAGTGDNPGSPEGIDFVAGWDEWVILDAAIKCLIKEESDPQMLMAERNDWLRTIEDAMSPRDAGQPQEMQDVYASLDEDYMEMLNS